MPFLGYSDLDTYTFSIDLLGRTDNYEYNIDMVGRTDNYEYSIDLVGRTANYQLQLVMAGATMNYYLTFPMEGKTSDKENYVYSLFMSGATQKTGLYQLSLSMIGSTALLPGSVSNPGTGTNPGTGPTGPGPGSSGAGSNSGDGSFGGESLVFHIVNTPSIPMSTYPMISFNASYTDTGTPTGDVTILGRVSSLPGDIYVSSKATDVYGTEYQATYGPFKSVGGYQQTKSNNGWITKFYFKDTTLEDTNTEDPSQKMPELPELVPWEVEKSYTPLDQAKWRREKDRKERLLRKKLKCLPLQKALYDDRSMLVDQLVLKALSYLPIPYILVSPPPFPGSKIYAENLITGGNYPDPSGTLIGTTASTSGKKPLEVMGEFWGAVGYTYKIVRGIVYIGHKDKIAETQAAVEGGKLNSGFMEESNLLNKYSVEMINDGGTTSSTPIPPDGSYTLPSSIVITGASYRKWLPPLDTEPSTEVEIINVEENDMDTFEKDPNGTISTTKDIYGDFVVVGSIKVVDEGASTPDKTVYKTIHKSQITYKDKLIATESTLTKKVNGRLSSQTKQRDGFVAITYSDGTQNHYWRNQYIETVKYEYLDSRFDLTATRITTTRSKVDQEGLNILGGVLLSIPDITETEVVVKEFHYSGYMMRKVVSSTVLDHFISSTREDAAGINDPYIPEIDHGEEDSTDGDGKAGDKKPKVDEFYRYQIYKNTVTTETYKPIGRGRWLKEVVSEVPRTVRTVRDITDPKWEAEQKYGTTLETYGDTIYSSREETDTPPEYGTKTPDAAGTSGSTDVICVEEPDIIKNGYSYDDPTKYTLYTSGRGDPITINLPFLQAAPGVSLTSTLAGLAEKYVEVNKLVNKTRTNGTFFVPVVPERYGQATSVNISITGSSCEVDFTMESSS